jgi:nitroimidazol reductase NimA-like FMN-containing flavoprotein (pyridoxamine 5'-phosphate oxidase superfamily)
MTELTEFGRLRTSGIKTQLPGKEMEKRIITALKSFNVCVLATCLNDVPRATPIEYYSDGLILYALASRQTKIINLEGNPRISVGIYNTPFTDWTDWHRVIGLQITGRPELLRYAENPEAYLAALSHYDWRKYRTAMGKPDDEPRNSTIIKITPLKIEYRDLGLMRLGYAASQVWTEKT